MQKSKFYNAFRKEASLFDRNKTIDCFEFVFDNKKYIVIKTRKRANKYTIIHCKNKSISWEQFPYVPRLTGRWFGEAEHLYSFEKTEDAIYLFVISGRCNKIYGLDEGCFCCATRPIAGKYLTVMSERAFRQYKEVS